MVEPGEAGYTGVADTGFLAAAGLAKTPSAAARSQAELVAMVHIRAAGGLWHRQGGGRLAMAHRLAASLLFSLIAPSSRHWRLSPLVRDIVALGAAEVPGSVTELASLVSPLAGEPYLSVVAATAGDIATADRRYQEVISLASAIAREVAALP
ncbi:MAG: hypothetical protein WCO00_01090 [Rhodospirillaceae bacterium]